MFLMFETAIYRSSFYSRGEINNTLYSTLTTHREKRTTAQATATEPGIDNVLQEAKSPSSSLSSYQVARSYEKNANKAGTGVRRRKCIPLTEAALLLLA